jgi:hypothetical protein
MSQTKEKTKKEEVALRLMTQKITIHHRKGEPDSIFFAWQGHEYCVMGADKKSMFLWYYRPFISRFFAYFSIEYPDYEVILKVWVEKTLKMNGFIPKWCMNWCHLVEKDIVRLIQTEQIL